MHLGEWGRKGEGRREGEAQHVRGGQGGLGWGGGCWRVRRGNGFGLAGAGREATRQEPK